MVNLQTGRLGLKMRVRGKMTNQNSKEKIFSRRVWSICPVPQKVEKNPTDIAMLYSKLGQIQCGSKVVSQPASIEG